MFYTDEFLSELKADPLAGAIRAIERAHRGFRDEGEWTAADYSVLMELLALLDELQVAGLIDVDLLAPEPQGDLSADSRAIYEYTVDVLRKLQASHHLEGLDAVRARFRASLGSAFSYEFSQGDLDRVQELISELRQQISAATFFEPDHQQRLLKRLEKLQAELHKKVGDLDRFWGLLGDAGVALGKFGTDAKPIVDRIREMTQIVWNTQARSEELPSNAPPPSLEDHSGGSHSA